MDITLFLTEFLTRITPSTVVTAVLASSGVLLMFIGLTSTTRIDLQAEMSRSMGVSEFSVFERAQRRLHAAGIYVSVFEVGLVGLVMGAGVCAVMLLTGFGAVSVLALVAGIPVYALWLTRARDQARAKFADALPGATDDIADLLKGSRALHDVLLHMRSKGPRETRMLFGEVQRQLQGQTRLDLALEVTARAFGDAHAAHVLNVLAEHYRSGNPNLHATLTRISRSRRDMSAQQRSIHAAQAGGRIVAWIYGIAPVAFLMLFRATSADYGRYYSEGAGQLVQLMVIGSGALSWWLARKVASRGLDVGDTAGLRAKAQWRPPPAPKHARAQQSSASQRVPGPATATGLPAPAQMVAAHGSAPAARVPATDVAAAQDALAQVQTEARSALRPGLARITRAAEKMVTVFVNGRKEMHNPSPLQLPKKGGKG